MMGEAIEKPVSIKGRKLARMAALQAVYQWQMVSQPCPQLLAQFCQQGRLDKKADKDYFSLLVEGVIQQCDQLDALVAPYFKQDPSRASEVDKAIIRLATYEIYYLSKLVDPSVAIDEAVKITKIFSGDRNYGFVNSVLHAFNVSLQKQ